jgi:hypothetical protein
VNKKEEKKKRRRGEREGKSKKRKNRKNRKGKFRHFTTSIQQMMSFCQTFSNTASAPSKKLLHRRSQSWSPAKQVLYIKTV